MATMIFQTQLLDAADHHHRAGARYSEGTGVGWNESSWDLMRGLDVIEHPSLEAWPHEMAGA